MARHRRCLAQHQTLLAPAQARILRHMREEAIPVKAVEVTVEEPHLGVYDQILEVAL